MANEQNLIPGGYKLSVEEQSKGGKASGEARRQRKAFKEVFGELLDRPMTEQQIEALDTDGSITEFARRQGVTPNDVMAIVMMLKAMKGDTKAFEIVRDTVGEKPADKQEVNIRELPKINVVRKDG